MQPPDINILSHNLLTKIYSEIIIYLIIYCIYDLFNCYEIINLQWFAAYLKKTVV